MKKILIISYLFPPNTTIVSSLRPYSWFTEFAKYNLEPTVITRHWSEKPTLNGGDLDKEDLSAPLIKTIEGQIVHYLPYKKSHIVKLVEVIEKIKWLSPLNALLKIAMLLNGKFSNESDINYAFKEYTIHLLKKERFDAVILSAMPVSAVRLGDTIRKRVGIPVFIDFRDYWNNNLSIVLMNFVGTSKLDVPTGKFSL